VPAGGKDKGTARWSRQSGMGRLRRANIKEAGRQGGWERLDEDDDAFERQGAIGRDSHAGESLLAAFNRLVASGRSAVRDGIPATVSELRPGLVIVRHADGREESAAIRRALEKRISGMRNTLAVGDRVLLAHEAGRAAIVAIEPRRSQLARTDSHNRSLQHVLAANVDLLVAVASVHEPDFKHGFVDRMLLVAAVQGLSAAVAITKRDLGDPAPMTELYGSLGYAAIAADARDPGDAGVAGLRKLMHGRTCVLAGQSGVGKSSLVNACFPGIGARVGVVAEAGFGRHTTTSARSFPLPGGGMLIDTPGIRECGIDGLGPVDVALRYPDLAPLQPHCRFPDCSHRHEPGCAVLEALEAGRIAPSRYMSYRTIVDGG
jgi:ribosome biogenesis GTPase